MHIDYKTALIGAIGGLAGGVLIAGISHFLGLEASRQELLKAARRDAYVQWLEVRTLFREVLQLKDKGKNVEAYKVEQNYHRKGREVMGKIATYGGKKIVESMAMWYRKDDKLRPCTYSSLQDKEALMAEIHIHQDMRYDLMPDEDLVIDANMAVLLLQCDLPPIPYERFSVSGEIYNNKDVTLNDCTVELLNNESTTVWASYEVESEFSLSFTVEPFKGNYPLLIKCPGYKDYKTIVDYGDSVTPLKPLALSIIRMKRK